MTDAPLPYDDDPAWNAALAGSLDQLDALAQRALRDFAEGRTVPMDTILGVPIVQGETDEPIPTATICQHSEGSQAYLGAYTDFKGKRQTLYLCERCSMKYTKEG